MQADRTLLARTADVRALADRLELEKFSLLGWSMGGQYAMACAYALAERVHHTAIIASCLP